MYRVYHLIYERNFYRNPSKSEEAVLKYIEKNFLNFPELTAIKIAKESFTSQATVNRTCKLLGFKGLSELKYAIQEDIKLLGNKPKYHIKNNTDVIKSINFESSVTIINNIKKNKKHILLFGLGASNITAQYFARQLLYLGIPAIVISERQMLSKFEGYFFLVISSSGETRRCIQMIEDAKLLNMKILSITKEGSTIMNMSDETFTHTVLVDKQDGLSREQQLHMFLMVNELVSQI